MSSATARFSPGSTKWDLIQILFLLHVLAKKEIIIFKNEANMNQTIKFAISSHTFIFTEFFKFNSLFSLS